MVGQYFFFKKRNSLVQSFLRAHRIVKGSWLHKRVPFGTLSNSLRKIIFWKFLGASPVSTLSKGVRSLKKHGSSMIHWMVKGSQLPNILLGTISAVAVVGF